MHRSEIAEFLLSRFTTREHAAAIVGDLMETDPGRLRFWLAVSRTALAFSTRPAAGVLVAVALGLLVPSLYTA